MRWKIIGINLKWKIFNLKFVTLISTVLLQSSKLLWTCLWKNSYTEKSHIWFNQAKSPDIILFSLNIMGKLYMLLCGTGYILLAKVQLYPWWSVLWYQQLKNNESMDWWEFSRISQWINSKCLQICLFINLFMTSKTKPRIHEFKMLHTGQRAF